MARKIVITSGKGGVGKTTLVANLGMILARFGYKTLLVDMDFGLNNLDVQMGVENKIVYDIIDVIEGKCSPSQAVIQDFFENNLFVLPSSHSFCSIKFGSAILSRIIKSLESQFDFVLIDCPAGIDGGFKRAVECADEFAIVTTPHLSAVRDAIKVVNCLKGVRDIEANVIVNRARGDLILGGEAISIDAIKDSIGGKLIGVIPDDDAVGRQVFFGGQIDMDSGFFRSVYMIGRNIVTGEDKIFDCTAKYRGFMGGIRKKLRKKV